MQCLAPDARSSSEWLQAVVAGVCMLRLAAHAEERANSAAPALMHCITHQPAPAPATLLVFTVHCSTIIVCPVCPALLCPAPSALLCPALDPACPACLPAGTTCPSRSWAATFTTSSSLSAAATPHSTTRRPSTGKAVLALLPLYISCVAASCRKQCCSAAAVPLLLCLCFRHRCRRRRRLLPAPHQHQHTHAPTIALPPPPPAGKPTCSGWTF